MLKGLYSAAAGMVSQMMQTDVTAHNLANISTAGFKRVNVQYKTFGDALMKRFDNAENQQIGYYAQGSQAFSHYTAFNQGDINRTGNTYDMSLRGDGFFVLKNADSGKEFYTRNGRFTLDKDRFLVDQDGNRVQGHNGDIQIPQGAEAVVVQLNGEVIADKSQIASMKIVQFNDNQILDRLDNGHYSSVATPKDATGCEVVQGFLEQSNANVITEMTNNIVGLRIYEALQQSIKMQNQTLDKAINEVGKM